MLLFIVELLASTLVEFIFHQCLRGADHCIEIIRENRPYNRPFDRNDRYQLKWNSNDDVIPFNRAIFKRFWGMNEDLSQIYRYKN